MKRLQPYFSFRGRSSRLTYWRMQLLSVVVVGVVVLVTMPLIIHAGRWSGFLLLILAPVLVALAATAVRRLHDRNRSGWWLAVYSLVPMGLSAWVETQMSGATEISLAVVLAALFSLCVSAWAMLDIGFLRGAKGPNRFGEDPWSRNPAESDGGQPLAWPWKSDHSFLAT